MGLLHSLWRRGADGGAGRVHLPEDITSAAMQAAIARWYRLYYDDEIRPGYDPSGRLAYTVVNKLVRTVFNEYRSALSGESEVAGGLGLALERLERVRDEAMMHCLIGGECLIKPVIVGGASPTLPHADCSDPEGFDGGCGGLDFVLIKRPAYRILGRDERGRATGYATIEVSNDGAFAYTLLEERRLLADGRCEIYSRLYRRRRNGSGLLGGLGDGAGPGAQGLSGGFGLGGFAGGAPGDLGEEVPLDSLERYAQLAQRVVLPLPLHSCGVIELKTPMANCVDGSADGVSIYAAACGLIEASARLEWALGREFDNAASRVIASGDMLRETPGGRVLEEDLFIALDDDPANVGITVYSPEIRDASFLRRKNDNLRGIENIIGLNRGILSEADAVRRTATEIATSEGEYNLTVQQLQDSWRACVMRVMDCCERLGRMYLGWGEGGFVPPQLDFGDGVLFDRDKAWQEYERMVQAGWLKPEVALAWYFGIEADDTEALERLMP